MELHFKRYSGNENKSQQSVYFICKLHPLNYMVTNAGMTVCLCACVTSPQVNPQVPQNTMNLKRACPQGSGLCPAGGRGAVRVGNYTADPESLCPLFSNPTWTWRTTALPSMERALTWELPGHSPPKSPAYLTFTQPVTSPPAAGRLGLRSKAVHQHSPHAAATPGSPEASSLMPGQR